MHVVEMAGALCFERRAASGHAAAAPPRSAMNSRRLTIASAKPNNPTNHVLKEF